MEPPNPVWLVLLQKEEIWTHTQAPEKSVHRRKITDRHRDSSCLHAKETGLRRNQTCCHLHLGFPASRPLRKQVPILWATLFELLCYDISNKQMHSTSLTPMIRKKKHWFKFRDQFFKMLKFVCIRLYFTRWHLCKSYPVTSSTVWELSGPKHFRKIHEPGHQTGSTA